MPPEPQYFRHKGNGRLYRLLHKCQHNSVCPGLPDKWIEVIVYQDDEGQVFSRQAIDFFAKFEPVDFVAAPAQNTPHDDTNDPKQMMADWEQRLKEKTIPALVAYIDGAEQPAHQWRNIKDPALLCRILWQGYDALPPSYRKYRIIIYQTSKGSVMATSPDVFHREWAHI